MDKRYVDYIVDSVINLARIPSPSGMTEEAINYVKKEFESLGIEAKLTNKGALIASIPGANKDEAKTLSAHVDTLGAMVKEIKGNGRIKLTNVGGFMWNSVEGECCYIHTSGGKTYSGTILTIKPSTHVYDDASKIDRKADTMEVRLDEVVKSSSDVLDLGISVGDFVSFDPRTTVTPSGFIKSRHLDDKASVGILLGVAKYIVESKIVPVNTIHFFISNYEEVGHGASGSIPKDTKEFVAVDMGAIGDGQSSDEYSVCICAKDSSGPYNLQLKNKLVALCKEKMINYKVDIYPYYGSDASAALRAGWDIVTGLVGPGIDASHSYERVHRDALENTAKLLVEYVK